MPKVKWVVLLCKSVENWLRVEKLSLKVGTFLRHSVHFTAVSTDVNQGYNFCKAVHETMLNIAIDTSNTTPENRLRHV